MKSKSVIALALASGTAAGALISPLFAQQEAVSSQPTCFVGEASSAACSGNAIYFAGNTSGLDDGVWIVRIDTQTGKIAYRNGKKLVTLNETE